MLANNRAAVGFVFIVILIDVIGLGIIIPVLPKLIQTLTHSAIGNASIYGGLLMFAYALMQFVFAPLLGGLSDQVGRRPVLLLSMFGFGVDYVFQAFAPTIFWLFVGRIIAGIFGASFTTATAYIADVSTPEKRAQNFGMIGAAFGIGFIIGPVIGGFLGKYGTHVPFLFAAALSFLNFIYGIFILPESLSIDKRRKFDWKRANPLGSLLQIKKYPVIMGLIGSFILIYIAGHAAQSTWTFVTIEKFGWDEKMVGYSLGFVGLSVAIVQGGLTRVLIPKLGMQKSVLLGLGFYILGFTLFAFATEGWMMFAFMIPYALGGLAGPSLQSIISAQVPDNEQGELQGALTSLISLTSVVGPLLMTGLFAYFTSPNAFVHFAGAPFLMGAVLTIASLLIAKAGLKRI